jgi:acyl-CoA dehydrogenase
LESSAGRNIHLLARCCAYIAGSASQAERGLKQMMEQVNLSRLSHGIRAAAMMRRCVNEAKICARGRVAFGKPAALIARSKPG